VNNAAGAAAVNVQDGGNSLTVDGVFFQATQPISAAALPLPAGASTSALQTQPGVDIGDVTINNAAGASAVNVQDAGNSLTVDAPVGTPLFARLSDGAAAMVGQKVMASSLPVVIASDQTSFPVAATLAAETTKVIGTTRILGNGGAIVDAATGAAVPANAFLTGARAATANPANATGGNMVSVLADKAGRLVVTNAHVRDLVGHQQAAVAATAETTIVTAGGAGVFNDLVQFIITTAGLAAQTITIKDATAGTTRFVLNYPNAAVAPGSPLVFNFDPPIPQATANANWTVTQSLATACNYTARFVKNT
jgi:hypothetical protein